MTQKPKIGKKFTPTNANPVHTHGHNSPADWARELFKPFKDGEVLEFAMKKIILDLDTAFIIDIYMIGVCSRIFCLHIWTTPMPKATFLTGDFVGN